VLPGWWFARFDPARKTRTQLRTAKPSSPEESTDPAIAVPLDQTPLPVQVPRHARTGSTFGRLISGELRILVQGVSRWWWLVALTLTVVGAVVPRSVVPALLLPIWVWPVLIWSRLGSQRVEQDVAGMLRAYPRARRRVLAEWTAGVVLTAGVAIGPGLRMAVGNDLPGLAAWIGGVLFIPSAALLLGVISRSHRLFQALYLPLWYLVVNGMAGLDYMGAVRVEGRPAGPAPGLVVGAAVSMLVVAVVVDNLRERGIARPWQRRARPGRAVRDREEFGARI
jgi:hypothetical protein